MIKRKSQGLDFFFPNKDERKAAKRNEKIAGDE